MPARERDTVRAGIGETQMLEEEDAEGLVPTSVAGNGPSQKAFPTKNHLVRNAFAVLQAFRGSDDWLTSRELSQRACLPKSSGHRLILTLEELGALVRGPHGRYRPGMLLVSLSQTVGIAQLLREASNRIMQDLAKRLQLTVHLGMLEDGMVAYVDKVSTPTAFPAYTRVGSKLEAYCSGLGKVLLAALPPDRLENFILDGDLVALTPQTITDRTQLRAELEKVRLQGYAVDDREYQADMRWVAVPICDSEGRVMAALSVTGRATEVPIEQCERIHCELTAMGRAITQRLSPNRGR
jgi:DNA-binding IclR family transcriptional regulator